MSNQEKGVLTPEIRVLLKEAPFVFPFVKEVFANRGKDLRRVSFGIPGVRETSITLSWTFKKRNFCLEIFPDGSHVQWTPTARIPQRSADLLPFSFLERKTPPVVPAELGDAIKWHKEQRKVWQFDDDLSFLGFLYNPFLWEFGQAVQNILKEKKGRLIRTELISPWTKAFLKNKAEGARFFVDLATEGDTSTMIVKVGTGSLLGSGDINFSPPPGQTVSHKGFVLKLQTAFDAIRKKHRSLPTETAHSSGGSSPVPGRLSLSLPYRNGP